MKEVMGRKILDGEAVRMTLSLCRDDGDVEAFLDAIPGYLEIDDGDGTCIDDIGSLLNPKATDMPLGHRMVHLLSTCIKGYGKMDEVARRHRAITCSQVVLELSRAVSSLTVKGLILYLPHTIGHKLQHLSRDHDPNIAFAAVKTIAVLERALLGQLLDAKDRMDPGRSAELEEVLAAAIGENDPASPRHQPGRRNDDRSDGRLIAVTEFTSNILELLKRSWHPSPQDIEDIKSVFKELSRGLNGRDFSPATQERFANVLSDTWEAHSTSARTGTLCLQFLNVGSHRCALYQDEQSSSETHHWAIIVSLKALATTLDVRFIELLTRRGVPRGFVAA